MIPFSVYVFEEMRLPLELLSATFVFALPLAKKKPHFLLRAFLLFLLLTLSSLLYFLIFGFVKENPRFPFFTVLWYLVVAFYSPLISFCCFFIRRADALLIGTLSFALQNIIYCFYHIFICRILFPAMRSHLILYVCGALLLCTLLFGLTYRVFAPLLKQSEGHLQEDTKRNIYLFAFVYIILYAFLIYYQAIFEKGYSEYDKMSWLSGVMVSVLILVMQYNAIGSVLYANKTKAMENLMANSEHYYELSKEHIAIINRKCHDLKHQLKILRNVDATERNDYIDEAEKSINFYQDLIYTNNEALNTILAEKGLFCRENDIGFHCSIDDTDLSFIRVSDLYAILGNAIDNAIEYTKKQADENLRSISLRIDSRKNFIGIQITNPLSTEDSTMFSSTFPATSKGDTYHHGFGLKSIQYLCEKYGGTMEYSTSDELFTLQILLPIA